MPSSVTPAAVSAVGVGPLVVRSVRTEVPDDLLALLPDESPLAWIRHGEGLIGWGEVARVDTSGPDRFAAADDWWTDTVGRAAVRDEVGLPGSGLVAFGSFTFSDAVSAGSAGTGSGGAGSALIVPRVVVGVRGQGSERRAWLTVVGVDGFPTPAAPLERAAAARAPRELRFSDGALSSASWACAVQDAVRRISRGELEKVVLARDLVAQADGPIDVRWPLSRLAAAYPTCWSFHVDGLLGATPELLVRRERGLVTSRVLAGTIQRTGDDPHDLGLAAALARSSKDLEEHEYAVRSVADALAPYCSAMVVPEAPFVLHLPNVMHLATDVTGVLHGVHNDGRGTSPGAGTGSLALAAALHPSAAVGGTPSGAAVDALRELEGMDRDRYAAPVGWIDAAGDGEWGIALRCGRVDGNGVRLFAGCGIVAGSEVGAELAEAHAKFRPVRDALATG